MEQNNQQGGGGGGAGGGMSQGYPQYQQQPQHQLMQQQQQQLHMFWAYQMQEIEQVSDFKNHQLPLARIKKIMKADEDVRMISAEAPVLFAKACEMFILELTLRSWIHAEENKRRTLQKNDIAAAITRTDIFDFLVDIVPRDDAKDEGFAALGRAAMPEGATGGGAGPYYYPPMAAAGVAATAAPPFMVGRPAMQMDPAALYMQQQQEAQRPYGMHQMWQPHQQPQQIPDGQAYGLPHQQQQMPDGQPYAMHQQQQDGHTYGTSAPSAD